MMYLTRHFLFPFFVVGFGIFVSCSSAYAGFSQFNENDPNYQLALSIAAAQEAQKDVDINEKIILDEEFAPEDFGLTNVGILPTSPFYFLKGIRRAVQSAFTFDPVAEVELKIRFSAEKLLEAKAVASQEGIDHDDIIYALENYHRELARVDDRVDDATEGLEEGKAVELAKKLMDSMVKYQKSLGKIEKNLPPELFENVKLAKEKTSETFGSVFDLVEPEKATEELAGVLEAQKGSEFKDFKNIEVLKEIEEQVPDQAKDAVRMAQEQALTRFQGELEKLQLAKKALFEDFVRTIGGNEARQLEIITELEAQPISEEVRAALVNAKEEALSKTDKRLQTFTPDQQEKFLEHLAQGEIKNVRVLKELEHNVSRGVLAGITRAKERAKGNIVEKVKEGEFKEEGKQELFGELERFHDTKSLAVLDEIEALIPSDKKAFFSELKQKAIVAIKRDIDRAGTASQRQVILSALAGDQPEQFDAIKSFQNVVTPFDVSAMWRGLLEAQSDRVKMRVEFIRDGERLARYEEEFRKREDVVDDFANIEQVFHTQRTAFESSKEEVFAQIRDAERLVAELEHLADNLPFEVGADGEGEFDPFVEDIERLLELAEQKIDQARAAAEDGNIGRAYGLKNAAANLARNGMRLAHDYTAGRKEVRCPFFFPPPPNFCLNGRIAQNIDQNGCQLPPRCEFVDGGQCPVPAPLPYNFCANGRIVYEKSSLGCPLPPRCEEFRTCPLVAEPKQCPEGSYREGFYQNGCFVYGECRTREEKPIICQAYWQGYVFDESIKACRQEGTSGCSDPFVYHTKEECERGNKPTICPAMPTVTSCPAGQRMVVTFSSPACGTYYGCESGTTTFTCNNNKVCEANENYTSCPGDCGGTGGGTNWVEHIWKFSDGVTEKSFILNRTDAEYFDYIAKIHAQCLTIPKSKFAWKPGAGNDDPANWQNFGIPDCSGTAVNYVCGNNSCDPGETSANCAVDCRATTAKSQCSDGIDNDNDGLIDYPKDIGCVDNFDDSESIGAGTGTTHCTTYVTEATCHAAERCVWSTSSSTCSKTTYDGDAYACPGFSYSKYDSTGARYCQLNNETKCEFFHPAYLTVANYTAGECPITTTTIKPQCSDGKDNDADGMIDYPADTGCYGADDNDEAYMATACSPETCYDAVYCADGKDNDGDGFIDMADPGCGGGSSTSSCDGTADSSQANCTAVSGCTWNATGNYCYPTSGGGTTSGSCSSPSTCYTSTSCAGAGYYWCASNSLCYSSSSSCPTSNYCGDHICSSNETSTSCWSDCGGGSTTACNNNGICDSGESSGSCPADCSTVTSGYCGDHVCSGSETATSCSMDCGGGTTSTTCASGYYWDTATQMCKPTSTTDCPSGQIWDEATHMCKSSTTGASLFTPFLKLFGF